MTVVLYVTAAAVSADPNYNGLDAADVSVTNTDNEVAGFQVVEVGGLAQLGDDLTVFRSMVKESANHTPALFMANSRFEFNGFPSMGAWISYGLGADTEQMQYGGVEVVPGNGTFNGLPTDAW